MTTNRDIPFAKSLVDYIFRWMGMRFIPGYREEHSPVAKREAEKAAEREAAGARNPATALDVPAGRLGVSPFGMAASPGRMGLADGPAV